MMVFYDVDTQIDFMEESGKLPVPGANKIRPNLKKLTDYALGEGILILGSSDRHFEDDEELETFPPHFMDGTLGQERIPETKTSEFVIENKYATGEFRTYLDHHLDEVIDPPAFPRITIEKQKTDVFSNPYTEKLFEKLEVERAIVYGVATDYCIKDAVLGMIDRNVEVYLVEDAISGIDEKLTKESLEKMYNSGVKQIKTEEVLGGDYS